MSITVRSRATRAPLVAFFAGALLFACSAPDQTIAPTRTSSPDLIPESSTPTPGVVTLCKVGADGVFSVQVGTTGAWSTVQIAHNSCQTIASVPPVQQDDVIVTITEQPRALYVLDHILLKRGGTADQIITSGSTVSFEAAHGAIVTYYNNPVLSVCKQGTAATFDYQIGLTGPHQSLSLADGECKAIGTPPAQQDDVIVTVRENPSSTYQLDHINLLRPSSAQETITGQTWVSFEGGHGAIVTFHNVPVTTSTGCTYTQGYYKNKGASLLPAGNFYASGQTYLGVLQTAPKGGNAYYMLAHQFIAATLNAKSASVPAAVQTALAQSGAYFATAGVTPAAPYTATYTKDKLTSWAELLGRYNEGLTGPQHCGDE